MEILNRYLSGIIMPFLLIILGLYFALKLKAFYILHPIRSFRQILKSQRYGYKSLTVALAGTLGVGNIVGVSSAILYGGIGSIFWMWVSAICAMGLKYAEVYLAMVFRHKRNGSYYGGAPYYIKDGLKVTLGKKCAFALSIIFTIFCVINSLTTGNLVQINSVSSLLPVNPLIFGIIFTVLAFLAISGGYRRISSVTSVLIPMLTIAYVFLCLSIIFTNYEKIPSVISNIFKDAFSLKSASGGFTGFGISLAIRHGVSKGVLSNEAGCGTSPMAHASTENIDPFSQGCLGIFEVFVDTILLCTLTAFVIILSAPNGDFSPMELVLTSFKGFTGSFGCALVVFLSISFAFATVICQFFYGTEALNYLSKRMWVKNAFAFVFSLVLIVGSVIPISLMWQISDLAISVMTIINILCLFLLRKHIK